MQLPLGPPGLAQQPVRSCRAAIIRPIWRCRSRESSRCSSSCGSTGWCAPECSRPAPASRQVGPQDELLLPHAALANLNWDPGDYARLDFAPMLRLGGEYAFGFTMGYYRQKQDRYTYRTAQDSIDVATHLGAPISASVLERGHGLAPDATRRRDDVPGVGMSKEACRSSRRSAAQGGLGAGGDGVSDCDADFSLAVLSSSDGVAPRGRHVGIARASARSPFTRLALHHLHVARGDATFLALRHDQLLIGVRGDLRQMRDHERLATLARHVLQRCSDCARRLRRRCPDRPRRTRASARRHAPPARP